MTLLRGGTSSLAQWIVSHRARRGPAEPDDSRELTAPPSRAWHVRTLILPVPTATGVQLLLLNLVTGRVGIAGFDDSPHRYPKGQDGHLVVTCLGPDCGHNGTLLFDPAKAVSHPRADALEVATPAFQFSIAGSWPNYRHEIEVPQLGLAASLRTACQAPLNWWSATHPLYSHYSAFGRTHGWVSLAGRRTTLDGWISLEHGCGGNLGWLPGRPAVPASLFHYQLGALSSGHLFALGCCSALYMELCRGGVLIERDGTRIPIHAWHLERPQVVPVADRCGGSLDVPVSFHMKAAAGSWSLEYDTFPIGDPPIDPVAGRGRLTSGGATLIGELTGPGGLLDVTGSVYLEHLSASDRAFPRVTPTDASARTAAHPWTH